jgi:mannose-6-phosphate isomerase-like protein (cupin superfamily)
MKVSAAEMLQRLPGAISDQWPMGERFAQALAHGSMSVEIYAPRETDPQTPHTQDELYFILSGSGTISIADERYPFGPGDCFFVAAGVEHRFDRFTPDFASWVVFWGPDGGEAAG